MGLNNTFQKIYNTIEVSLVHRAKILKNLVFHRYFGSNFHVFLIKNFKWPFLKGPLLLFFENLEFGSILVQN